MISFVNEQALSYFVEVIIEIGSVPPSSSLDLVEEMMKPFRRLMKQEGFKVWKDFAPWSFRFKTDTITSGGIIYEGPDSPADGSFPSFTVSVDPSNKPTWRIHT